MFSHQEISCPSSIMIMMPASSPIPLLRTTTASLRTYCRVSSSSIALANNFRATSASWRRYMANYNRPAPPSLPKELQREFEELQRKAQAPLANAGSNLSREELEAELSLHPDARRPVEPEFQGDTNPITGEKGGPKREPVRHWVDGDWSNKGRVTDF